MRHFTFARACALALLLGLGSGAMAQGPGPTDPYPQSPQYPPQSPQYPPYPQYPTYPQAPQYPTYPQTPQEPQEPPAPQNPQYPQDPAGPTQEGTEQQVPDGTARPDLTPPAGDPLVTEPQPGLQDGTSPPDEESDDGLLDGHPRTGPFLAAPGSLAFILHHSLLAGMGGFATQLVSARFDFERGKEGLLVGSLVGAGIGFGVSTWWQFTHWTDLPVASLTIVNAAFAGMLAAGMVDSLSNDLTALAWSSFIGAELASWATVAVAGGDLPAGDALAMISGGAWAAAYTALVLATLTYAGGVPPEARAWVDALLISPALGAAAMAVALQQIRPTAMQVLRGDLLGLGIGAVVLVTSGFVVGFETTTTYVLAGLCSALALAAVSFFWEEAAETQPEPEAARAPYGKRRFSSKRPYNNPWW